MRLLIRFFYTSFLAGKDVGCLGRKRKLEVSELSGIQKKICDGALTLQTLTKDEVRLEIQQTLLKKRGHNKHADLANFAEISDRTVTTYIKDMSGSKVKGKIQAASRVEPFNDIILYVSFKIIYLYI